MIGFVREVMMFHLQENHHVPRQAIRHALKIMIILGCGLEFIAYSTKKRASVISVNLPTFMHENTATLHRLKAQNALT